MRTGVVDVSGQGLSLHVFDHDSTGATAVLHKVVTLHLQRHEGAMVPAPGLVDLAAETVRRLALAAAEVGCSYLRVTLADGLGDELAAHFDLTLDGLRETAIGEKPCTVHGIDPLPDGGRGRDRPRLPTSGFLDGVDVRQTTETLGVVDPVPDHEPGSDLHAEVFR